MTNNKQQTAVDIAELAMKLYPFSNSERNAFITGYNKAKEMEKDRMIEFAEQVFRNRYNEVYQSLTKVATDTFNETYGGGEQ
jgi:hypothetical protein